MCGFYKLPGFIYLYRTWPPKTEIFDHLRQWGTLVSRIQLIIITTVYKTTKRTPLQTIFGCDHRLPEIQRIIENVSDEKLPTSAVQHEKWREFVKRRLDENTIQQDERSRNRSKPQKVYNIGDYVLVSRDTNKLRNFESGWFGPYKVTHILSPGRYELRKVGDD